MKNLIIVLITAALVTGCIAKRETLNTTSSGINYRVGEETKARVMGSRLWITFIPIGIGPFKYDTQREKVIHRFLKHTKAEAITGGRIKVRKIIIPLILVNYSLRICTITGKPCYLQSDTLKK
jgi:hypothetical protein